MNGIGNKLRRLRTRGTRGIAAAFTLIELLVVIAIIGILAAMLLPVLTRTKLKATLAACLANEKQLSLAFVMYADDNQDRIVASRSARPGFGWDADGYWGPPNPDPYNGNNGGGWQTTGLTSDQALAAVQSALQNFNLLYRYDANVAGYHCPGDTRFKRPINSGGWAYDSYSKTDNVGGEGKGSPAITPYTKMSQITRPSQTLTFLEDADTRGYNVGTFEFDFYNTPPWRDPPAMFHGNVDTTSFADGHAEGHRWSDPNLILYGQQAGQGVLGAYDLLNKPGLPTSGADFNYIHNHFFFQGNP